MTFTQGHRDPDRLAAFDTLSRDHSALERVNRRYRYELEGMDERAVDLLVRQYSGIQDRLRERTKDLQAKVKEAEANGVTPTPDWLYRQERYKDLTLELNREMVKAGRGQLDYLEEDTAERIRKAEDYVRKASRAQLERTAPNKEALSSVMGRFNSLPEEQIKSILGNLQSGSPLHTLLIQSVPQEVGERVRASLVETIARGAGTRAGGLDLSRELGWGLSRSMTVVRTETHRVQREATRRSYLANADVVKGWVWRCARTGETCEVCWAMDGTEFALNDPFDTHINCRCTSIPLTRSWEELGFPGVPEIDQLPPASTEFDKLPEKDKLRILGRGKLEAYNQGHITLKDMVGTRFDKEWGGSRHGVSLAQAYKNAGRTMPSHVRDALPPGQRALTPNQLEEHEEALRSVLGVGDARGAELDALTEQLRQERNEYDALQRDRGAYMAAERAKGRSYFDIYNDPYMTQGQERLEHLGLSMSQLAKEKRGIQESINQEARAFLKVNDPVSLNITSYGTKDKDALANRMAGTREFESMVSKSGTRMDGFSVEYTTQRGRAFARNGEVHVTKDETVGTIVHELGHNLEFSDPDVLARSLAWRAERAGNEPLSWMGPGYRRDERAQADEFMNKYIGKDYGSYASEVVSMGVQYFYEDPVGMARQDPDYFAYIYNTLRGKPYTSSGSKALAGGGGNP